MICIQIITGLSRPYLNSVVCDIIKDTCYEVLSGDGYSIDSTWNRVIVGVMVGVKPGDIWCHAHVKAIMYGR